MECQVCGAEFVHVGELEAHEAEHHGEVDRAFECNEPGCGQSFSCRSHLNRHVAWKHDKKQRKKGVFRCSVCGKAERDQWNLQQHERSHRTDKQFKCDMCSLNFTTKSSLNRHNQSRHQAAQFVQDIMCEEEGCQAVFHRVDSYRRHLRRVHKRESDAKRPRRMSLPAHVSRPPLLPSPPPTVRSRLPHAASRRSLPPLAPAPAPPAPLAAAPAPAFAPPPSRLRRTLAHGAVAKWTGLLPLCQRASPTNRLARQSVVARAEKPSPRPACGQGRGGKRRGGLLSGRTARPRPKRRHTAPPPAKPSIWPPRRQLPDLEVVEIGSSNDGEGEDDDNINNDDDEEEEAEEDDDDEEEEELDVVKPWTPTPPPKSSARPDSLPGSPREGVRPTTPTSGSPEPQRQGDDEASDGLQWAAHDSSFEGAQRLELASPLSSQSDAAAAGHARDGPVEPGDSDSEQQQQQLELEEEEEEEEEENELLHEKEKEGRKDDGKRGEGHAEEEEETGPSLQENDHEEERGNEEQRGTPETEKAWHVGAKRKRQTGEAAGEPEHSARKRPSTGPDTPLSSSQGGKKVVSRSSGVWV